jgi:hypothetical protein
MEAHNMTPSKENRNLKYIKPVGIDELTDQPNLEGANVTRVEHEILEYVRKQMHRATATGEVIGQAILFQEEMDREMRIIEAELTSEIGEEEAFRSRW